MLYNILIPPNGEKNIIKTFGNIYNFINDDNSLHEDWRMSYLDYVYIPIKIPLCSNLNHKIDKFLCHKILIDTFYQIFVKIKSEGLQDSIISFGGCFNYRKINNSQKYSTHCWGIAIDLNPSTNATRSAGNMDKEIIQIFKSFNFFWGGDWNKEQRDPMHFQFCSGY